MRQQLRSISLVLTIALGVSVVAGVATGEVDRVGASVPGHLSDQHAEFAVGGNGSANSTQGLTTVQTAVEKTVVTRNVTVNVTAFVQNDAERAATDSLTFSVDGHQVSTRQVTVPANGTDRIEFTHSFTDVGVHTVSVGNSSTMVGIIKPASALPVVNQSAADRGSRTATPGTTGTTSFGLVVALVGVGAATVVLLGLLALRRRGHDDPEDDG